MILSVAIAASLADKCAPRIARETLLSVAYHESRLDTLAIGDNSSGRRFHPRSRKEAVEIAQAMIARGHSIDMGIGQINSRTASRLGLTVFGAFDVCQNMAAVGALMERNYRRVTDAGSPQRSLAAMLSMYNTGDSWRGFGNGYVGSVYRAAATVVTQLGRTPRVDIDPGAIDPIRIVGPTQGAPVPIMSPATMRASSTEPLERPAPPPPWAAFGNPINVMVFGTRRKNGEAFDPKEDSQ